MSPNTSSNPASPFLPGQLLTIKVKPRARTNKIDFTSDPILVSVTAPAHDHLANEAVVKIFKKQLHVRIEIIHGQTSSLKRIRVLG